MTQQNETGLGRSGSLQAGGLAAVSAEEVGKRRVKRGD